MVVLTDEHIDELNQLMSDIFSHEYPGSYNSDVGSLGYPETFASRFRQFNHNVYSFNEKIDKKRLDDALSSSI